MFNRKKKRSKGVTDKMLMQAIGGQSVMNGLFTETLDVPPDQIRKIELTYFSLSVTSQ